MKKMFLSTIALALAAASFSQVSAYKKRPTLGINFMLQDMTTISAIEKSSIGSVLNNKQWANLTDLFPGLNIQYFEGISDHLDFMATLGGSFTKYPFYSKSGVKPSTDNRFLLEADANVNFKLLSDNYFLVPYLRLGIGASMYNGTYFAAYAPAGAGLQFNLGEGTFLNAQLTYKAAVSSLAVNYLTYSLGIAAPLTSKKAEPVVVTPPPPPPPVVTDKDGDGIPDTQDKCPDVPGTAKYNGCPVPDTDGDGINDENDKCPTVKGIAKYDGCPVPDTDGDGINDEDDKCPTVKGVARYQGCPVPDRDNDGVNDEEDRCPDVPGTKENHGCPVVKEEVTKKVNTSAKNIFFVTNSDKLMPKSFKALDEVAAILGEDKALKLDIEGHTDITGGDKINVPLSEKRAKAVFNYLSKAGVDESRMTSAGFASSKPIADNKTAKGRALNRRVEMKLKYY